LLHKEDRTFGIKLDGNHTKDENGSKKYECDEADEDVEDSFHHTITTPYGFIGDRLINYIFDIWRVVQKILEMS